MPDLLLELFSEEIPARMQARAADDLRRLVTDALVERGVLYEGASAYATPRRLALTVHGLPLRQPDTREERKGPRVGAPDAAVQGFLRAAGLQSLDQASVQRDPKKGEFYVAVVERPGRPVPDLVAEIVPEVVRGFPWPKSMRWGSGSLRWVRPLHSILCTFAQEGEEPEVVRLSVDGIEAADVTRGHRFMAPGPIRVRRFDDYVASLGAARVVLDAGRRRDTILHEARNLAFAAGLELVEDEAVLDEAAGLVEWPVVLLGAFDPAFLEVPAEAIQATIRANQKCLVLRDPATGRLAARFVLVANIEASDGGAAIVAGNERVIRARLSDARFFWETDQKPLPGFEERGPPLDQRLARMADLEVVFHERLGTQDQRVRRIVSLARELAPLVGADVEQAERAATLAKADLMTEMVGEFPELQGLMGRLYAELQGEAPAVSAAIEDHYRPKGASDRVPTAPVSIAVALADKLDTLLGFWTIGEKPTGSKDPFALRRAALGIIRIVLENGLRLPLAALIQRRLVRTRMALSLTAIGPLVERAVTEAVTGAVGALTGQPAEPAPPAAEVVPAGWNAAAVAEDLLAFLADRLTVQLREQGARHDLVDAVFALPGQDDLVQVVRRVEALGSFLDTEDGRTLLAGVRRAGNILRIEEKKDGEGAFAGAVDASLLAEPEEQALAAALDDARVGVERAVAAEDYEGAMSALAQLRAPVDAFFDRILVNAGDAGLRANRLRLLSAIRDTTRAVADFTRIAG